MQLSLPDPWTARPYRGTADHASMASILGAYHLSVNAFDIPTADQFDHAYAHLQFCDPQRDVVMIEAAGEPVAYARTKFEPLADGTHTAELFARFHPDHLVEPLYSAVITGLETHVRNQYLGGPTDRLMTYTSHPGEGRPATGESAWAEALGFSARQFQAGLVRPTLNGIPDRRVPDGVEIRRVTDDDLPAIFAAHHAAFEHEWDFYEATDADLAKFISNPLRDNDLWRVAWHGDEVVGQVKSYVNDHENDVARRLRGYTEEISTHRDWRGRGVASALICASLHALRQRGMAEAALSADTDSPTGAFRLYQSLGFTIVNYDATYTKPW